MSTGDGIERGRKLGREEGRGGLCLLSRAWLDVCLVCCGFEA